MGYRRQGLPRVVGYETASKERRVSFVLSEPNADAQAGGIFTRVVDSFMSLLALGC